MNKIYKYSLVANSDGTMVVALPASAVVLSTAFQGNTLCVWAAVETRNIPHAKNRIFHVIPTGGNVPLSNGKSLIFVGTVHQLDLGFVFHVFVEPETFTLNRTA